MEYPALNRLVTGQLLEPHPQAHGAGLPPSSPPALRLLQVVAGADMAGQGPKALMPTGDGAGLCSTTCLGTCRSSPRASTSSIRWIAHKGVCLGGGTGQEQAEEMEEGNGTHLREHVPLRPHLHVGDCGETVTHVSDLSKV